MRSSSRLGRRTRTALRVARTCALALFVTSVLLVSPAPEDPLFVQPVRAQGLNCLPVLLECDFEVEITDWNGTGIPGSIISGTATITNTGTVADSYRITAESDQDWQVDVDPNSTDPVDADDTTEIQINVLIPETAGYQETTTIQLTVTSQNDAEISGMKTFEATAAQSHAWHLICDTETTIQKGRSDNIRLQIRNTGNGEDTATITTRPLPEGITIGDIDPITLGAGANGARNVTIQVGISLEEGDYQIDWDLQSQGRDTARAVCSTTLNAIIGESTMQDDDSEESPLPLAVPLLVLLSITLLAHKRRRK
jgi:uncharacterized membrane protein